MLRADGHDVTAVQLRNDATPAASLHMSDYINTVVAAVDAATAPPSAGPGRRGDDDRGAGGGGGGGGRGGGNQVVLVGHSLAGAIISGVAELRPAAIKLLVYVAAYLPRNGSSVQGLNVYNSVCVCVRV